ncbi:transposable element Tcb2 transposase [Trichonephila clavipes]|uniref:Transposable element Tcb2 transposase n=1 Tax=Trichonephila clavipes TaxID=2585209 RepID=A0A8X6V1Y4_TRICX|nr:transposable element Tcb2 transposase [Trichonephila clavipes]
MAAVAEWYRYRTVACFVTGGVGTSRSERCHLHEDQAQDTLDRPVIEKTATSEESRFNLSSDDNSVRVWRPLGERLNPAFALQRNTTPTAGVMVWSAIAYNTQLPLVLIHGTMTAQWYVHDILHPYVLPLMQGLRLPGAIFQQDNTRPHTARVSQDCLRLIVSHRAFALEGFNTVLNSPFFCCFSEINDPFSLIF